MLVHVRPYCRTRAISKHAILDTYGYRSDDWRNQVILCILSAVSNFQLDEIQYQRDCLQSLDNTEIEAAKSGHGIFMDVVDWIMAHKYRVQCAFVVVCCGYYAIRGYRKHTLSQVIVWNQFYKCQASR